MSVKKMKKEDLEIMSYSDIANLLLEESKEESTADLFRKIMELLEMPKSAFEKKIGDFFTALTNDKRFILLESGDWGLRKDHKVSNLIKSEDLDDIDDIEDDSYDDIEEEPEEDPFAEDSEDDTDDVAEEYKNLVIVDEEDLESQE